MKQKVVAKQPNSKMCMVCGIENDRGLKASFFELENRHIYSVFEPVEPLQGYPGRLHGGVASMILDETIGRAIMIDYGSDIWGVTIHLNMKFRKPVPLDEPIQTFGMIEKEAKRSFVGHGQIVLADGTVAIEATGKYLKMPIGQITDFDVDHLQWRVHSSDSDPDWIDVQAVFEPKSEAN